MAPQADLVIANQSGSAFRADLNNQLAALGTLMSGSSAPSTTYAYMLWADTTNGVLKIRNSANNAWIELLQLDGTLTMEDGAEATPGLAFRDDLNTGIWSSAADTFNISTGGTERFRITSDGDVKITKPGSDASAKLEITQSGGGGGTSEILFSDAVSGRGRIFYDHGSSPEGIKLEAANTIGLSVTTAGKVGIGTTATDPTELLEVNSTSASTAIEISAGEASTTTGESKLVLRSLHSSSGTGYSRSEIASLGVAGGDSDLIFRTTTDVSGPQEKMRITYDGNVTIQDGNLVVADGHGINFHNYGSEDNDDDTDVVDNLLDDYEYGTYIPIISQGLDWPTSGNEYHFRSGHYIKIGNKVHVDFYIYLNEADANNDQYRVGGFPFNLKSSNHIRGGGCTTYWSLPVASGSGSTGAVSSFYGISGSNAASLYQGNLSNKGANGTSADAKYLVGFFEYICA